MARSEMVDIHGTDGVSAAYVRRGDWVALIVNDPNGPALATIGQVDGWNDEGIRVSDQRDLRIPWNTIRAAYAIDGPVTEPIEFDPQRPVHRTSPEANLAYRKRMGDPDTRES